MKRIHIAAVVSLASLFLSVVAQAAADPLQSRLGGLAYYDPNLDITWSTDANINGQTAWQEQVDWAADLEIGGVTGWRLPNADVNGDDQVVSCQGASASACADNEMGFLFWQEGISNTAPGPFTDVDLVNYWSGTTLASDSTAAWQFFFNVGTQITSAKTANNFAWAVHDGDVAAVPLPAAIGIFAAGVGVLGWCRRRK